MKTLLLNLLALLDASYPMHWHTRRFERGVAAGKTPDAAYHDANAESRIHFGHLGWN